MLHCALYQKGVSLENDIRRLLEQEEVTLHTFVSAPQLFVNPRRYDLDLLFFAPRRDLSEPLRILKHIQQDVVLSLPPAVFLLHHPSERVLLRCYQAGVDEVCNLSASSKILSSKLRNLIEHSRKSLGVNPSTKLPGVSLIDEEIRRRTKRNERFALCYADLDQFKAFNDYYGYFYGNQLIVATSKIIRDIVSDLAPGGFVGHVGGDDFIFIIPIEKVKEICKGIIKVFDKTIPSSYHEKDLRKGYIETPNRDGVMERFSIMSISIAVFKNAGSTFSHIAEISHMLADLKKYVKALPGSNYVIERRRKY
jgi:diguanylate cyclase (GGDEF)-like protein